MNELDKYALRQLFNDLTTTQEVKDKIALVRQKNTQFLNIGAQIVTLQNQINSLDLQYETLRQQIENLLEELHLTAQNK